MAILLELIRNISKPATRLYPKKKRETTRGFRGLIHYDTGRCIGCGLCERDCPSAAIEMINKGKEAWFRVHLDRCSFCSQCADSCPVKAVTLTEKYELASLKKDDLTLEFRRTPPSEP